MKKAIWGAVILLAILHQDWWYWNDPTIVLGFLPIGLAYHMLFSLAASGLWAIAVFKCWPAEVDRIEEETRVTFGGPGH